jgi:hypothetical protein
MATLLKVLNNLADIKSAGGVALASELRPSSTRCTSTRADDHRREIVVDFYRFDGGRSRGDAERLHSPALPAGAWI